MPILKWLFCVPSLAFVLAGCQARLSSDLLAGTESHGTGGPRDRYNPWFLSRQNAPKTIPYCVVTAEGGRHQRDDLRALVVQAGKKWEDFFRRYGYQNRFLGGDPDFTFHDGELRRVAFELEEIPECDDTAHQLRIVFSSEKPSGEPVDAYLNENVGAAIRGPYDHRTYRTGGTVWVHDRRNYAAPPPLRALEHTLLHELGHVFGMRHEETWVMHEEAGKVSLPHRTIAGHAYDLDLGRIELPDWRFRLLPGDVIKFSRFEFSRPKFKDAETTARLMEALWSELGVNMRFPSLELRYDGVVNDEITFTATVVDLGDKDAKPVTGSGTFGEPYGFFRTDLGLGPSVFTHFGMGSRTRALLATFWDETDVTPRSGTFTFGRKRFPAQIASRFGQSLRLEIPDKSGFLRFYSEREPVFLR